MALRTSIEGVPYESVEVPADEMALHRVYAIAPSGSAPALTEHTDIRFWVEDLQSGERVSSDSVFIGAGK